MAVQHIPDLIHAGCSCLKIEGRLKGPEYVALTTQVCSLHVHYLSMLFTSYFILQLALTSFAISVALLQH
jgi:hypothetical protein